jgi:crossover junction endodeoxyribonuclease RusA
MSDQPPTEGTFFVLGLPATKGSSVSFVGRSGQMVHKASCKRLTGWQKAVARAVDVTTPLPGGLWLTVEFRLPRPKSHYVNGDGQRVKPTAPVSHTTKPDIDKLQRALLDGLTGALYADDSQVVRVSAAKRYVDAGDVGASVTWGTMWDATNRFASPAPAPQRADLGELGDLGTAAGLGGATG